MQNVHEIREKNNLFRVLSYESGFSTSDKSIGVFICLYYDDSIAKYKKYILSAISVGTVYILSSRTYILNQARDIFGVNCQYILKENRGRDISALLIGAKPYVREYDYWCFIHDKKARNESESDNIDQWINEMWDSVIPTKGYIRNVLELFEINPKLGLLCPPEVFCEEMPFWYRTGWENNYDGVVDLVNSFELKCNYEQHFAPISFGTIFWCKKHALDKLLSYEWKYEDFVDEPLPADGTISHAIERALPLFAQDAGFQTGTIMSCKCASRYFNSSQSILKRTYDILRDTYNIDNADILYRLVNCLEFCKDERGKGKNICIYGAGIVAKRIINFLIGSGCIVDFVAVTDIQENPSSIRGIKVCSINSIPNRTNCAFIIGVGKKQQREIIDILFDYGIQDYLLY